MLRHHVGAICKRFIVDNNFVDFYSDLFMTLRSRWEELYNWLYVIDFRGIIHNLLDINIKSKLTNKMTCVMCVIHK